MTTLDDLAASVAPVTVPDLFECIGQAGFDISRAIREGNQELGEGASSALLNAIALLPLDLRQDISRAALDRSLMHPRLQRLAL